MSSFTSWLRQPTTIAGISGMLGALAAVLQGQMTWHQATPVLLSAAVAIAVPDNTNSQSH